MQNNYTKRAKRTQSHRYGSIEKCGIRVSPNDPPIHNACQFKSKKNERAFIYTPNFRTYDGQKI